MGTTQNKVPLISDSVCVQDGPAAPRMGSGSMFDRIAFVYDSTNKHLVSDAIPEEESAAPFGGSRAL